MRSIWCARPREVRTAEVRSCRHSSTSSRPPRGCPRAQSVIARRGHGHEAGKEYAHARGGRSSSRLQTCRRERRLLRRQRATRASITSRCRWALCVGAPGSADPPSPSQLPLPGDDNTNVSLSVSPHSTHRRGRLSHKNHFSAHLYSTRVIRVKSKLQNRYTRVYVLYIQFCFTLCGTRARGARTPRCFLVLPLTHAAGILFEMQLSPPPPALTASGLTPTTVYPGKSRCMVSTAFLSASAKRRARPGL